MSPGRNSRTVLAAIFAAAALALAGCSRLPVYSHFEDLPAEGWRQTDTLHFAARAEQAGSYQPLLGLRASSRYPYTQLTLIVCRQGPDGQAVASDTLTFSITDAEGNVLGRGLSAYQYDLPLPPLSLAAGEHYAVAVWHGMSRFLLPGITDVGITLAAAP